MGVGLEFYDQNGKLCFSDKTLLLRYVRKFTSKVSQVPKLGSGEVLAIRPTSYENFKNGLVECFIFSFSAIQNNMGVSVFSETGQRNDLPISGKLVNVLRIGIVGGGYSTSEKIFEGLPSGVYAIIVPKYRSWVEDAYNTLGGGRVTGVDYHYLWDNYRITSTGFRSKIDGFIMAGEGHYNQGLNLYSKGILLSKEPTTVMVIDVAGL